MCSARLPLKAGILLSAMITGKGCGKRPALATPLLLTQDGPACKVHGKIADTYLVRTSRLLKNYLRCHRGVKSRLNAHLLHVNSAFFADFFLALAASPTFFKQSARDKDMKKLLKTLLTTIAVLAVLLVLAVLALPFMIDPNSFKGAIKQAAARQNLSLELTGPLDWQFYPKLGLSLEGLEVAPLDKPDEPLLEARSGSAAVALRPLFSRKVMVDELVLQGLALNLQVD